MSNSEKNVPISAGQLKKGQFVVFKERPCKIIDMKTSKTGKHGHAKVMKMFVQVHIQCNNQF